MKLTDAPPSTQSSRTPASASRCWRPSAAVRRRIWIIQRAYDAMGSPGQPTYGVYCSEAVRGETLDADT